MKLGKSLLPVKIRGICALQCAVVKDECLRRGKNEADGLAIVCGKFVDWDEGNSAPLFFGLEA